MKRSQKQLFVVGVSLALVGAVVPTAPTQAREELSIIDTHNHLNGRIPEGQGNVELDYEGAVQTALRTMDSLGIRKMLIMPPPQPLRLKNGYAIEDFEDAIKKHSDRFGFLGGGGSLNPMIQEAVKEGETSSSLRIKFEKRAREILEKGAVGFGELTTEHMSMHKGHPYVSAPPDHPLLLSLADIAAMHGVPMDIHMDAVPFDMPTPEHFLQRGDNPEDLHANIPAFERLLAHNRKANIIWVHAGWDNTGYRSPERMAQLLQDHPNLYMSLRVPPEHMQGGVRRPNSLIGKDGYINAEWLKVLKAYPDRFLVGSDEFFPSPRHPMQRHPSSESSTWTIAFLKLLPEDLAQKIAYENAERLFKLK